MKNSKLYSVMRMLSFLLLLHIPQVEAGNASTSDRVTKEATNARSQSLSVIQGRVITKKYYGKLESRARKAVVINTKTRRALPKNWVQATVRPGAAIIKDRSGKVVMDKNGKPRKKPYALVTIKTTSNVQPGTYQLLLLDQRGKPLSYKDKKTQRIVKVAPKSLIVMLPDAAKKSQTISSKTVAPTPGSTNVPLIYSQKNVQDINKRVVDSQRANIIADRMSQFGEWASLQDFSSLGNKAAPRGIGPGLINSASDLRKGMIDKLGFWPANSQGSIGRYDVDASGTNLKPSTPDRISLTNPAKTGIATTGTAGDTRIMAEGASGTGADDKKEGADKEGADKEEMTSEVTTQDEDKQNESTDGNTSSQTGSQTSTVNVDNSDGSKLAHTVTQTTHANGSTTSSQSVYYRDQNGSVTTYHTATNSNGSTTTSCNGQLCTPDPESTGCSGAACENFEKTTAMLLGNLDEGGINNMQTESGSMMQPADVGSRSGKLDSLRSTDRDLYQKTLNPYILYDGEITQGGARPQSTTGAPSIGGQSPETLIDPSDPEVDVGGDRPPKTR